MSILTDDERARVHREVDKLLDMPCMDGFLLFFASFTNEGDVDVATVGKGAIHANNYIDAVLRLLADQCRIFGTPTALKMESAIKMLQAYMAFLLEENADPEHASSNAATEVRQ